MKRLIVIVLLMVQIILLAPLTASAGPECDYRSTHWGMTKRQVEDAEILDIIAEYDDRLLYGGATILSVPCEVNYSFLDGVLDEVNVYFMEIGNAERYVSHFNNLLAALQKKYGKPTQLHNLDKLKDGSFSHSGGIEEVEIGAVWVLKRTRIMLIMYKEYDEIKLNIAYCNQHAGAGV